MANRYDFMEESDVRDIDNVAYYDPLSVSFNDVQLTSAPDAVRIADKDITKIWLFMRDNYGVQDEDDILLELNEIPYRGMLKPGDTLYLISKNDLDNFATQKLGSSEDF